jgi:AcrR family transcriptional regulator
VPRAGLNPERVVRAAADLADEVGLEHVSLAAVAKQVGVATPSLYKHVDSLDAVRGALAVLAVAELGTALARAATGRSGERALRAMGGAYRRYAGRHPGRYAASLRAPAVEDREHEAAAAEVLATVLAVLDGYGLEGDDAVDAARFLRSSLHGFVALEAAGGFGLPRDLDRSFDRLLAAIHSALADWAAGATVSVAPNSVG